MGASEINWKWRKAQNGNVQTMENHAPRLAENRQFQLAVSLPDTTVFRHFLCARLENSAFSGAVSRINWKTRKGWKTPLGKAVAWDFKSHSARPLSTLIPTGFRFVPLSPYEGARDLSERGRGLSSPSPQRVGSGS